MDRHEMKARIETQIDEWKRNLETLRAKADASADSTKVEYLEAVTKYQKQLDDLKIQAATTWDVADDLWETTSKDLELKWDQWVLDAKKAWSDASK